ncbi:hypothetical protein AB3N58_17750 (plasmid) [Leptospira sp. WS60.C2]
MGNNTHFQKLFDKLRIDFNRIRPHEALNMKIPEQVYDLLNHLIRILIYSSHIFVGSSKGM